MNKTEEVIGHLLSESQHVSAVVTDDTEVWETHNKLVEHIRELDRKAEAWDKLNEYVSTSPYDGIDMDTLKNRLNRFINESGESE